MRARVAALQELSRCDVSRWAECADFALEPNPFLEPDWLLPAVGYLGEAPRAALVMAEQGGAVRACVPLFEAETNGRGGTHPRRVLNTRVVPVAMGIGTPLVTAEGGVEALSCLMEEIVRQAEHRLADLVVWEWLAGDGPVIPLLHEAASAAGVRLARFDTWERGLLRRRPNESNPYWLGAIGKHRQRTIRQHHAHLVMALGTEPCMRTRTDAAAVEDFLRLESSGWKGHGAGMAFGRHAGSRHFFTTVCERFLSNGRMWFPTLEGPDGPIAMLCCVRAGDGVFCYRTAYDEKFARFGPGVEIFLSAMEQFDRETDAAYMDSCAEAGDEHLLGLFPDRRIVTTMIARVHARPHESGEPSPASPPPADSPGLAGSR